MWDGTDAWILQSVASSDGDLASIIGHADAINVSIPTRAELGRSVDRLASAGFVEVDGRSVRATRSGRALVRRSSRLTQGFRTVTPRLVEALRARGAEEGSVGWTLSDDEWQAAYDAYRARMRR